MAVAERDKHAGHSSSIFSEEHIQPHDSSGNRTFSRSNVVGHRSDTLLQE